MVSLSTISLKAPATPDADEARRAAKKELSRQIYHEKPDLWDRIWRWILDHLDTGSMVPGVPSWVSTVIVVIVIAVGIALLILLLTRISSARRVVKPSLSVLTDDRDAVTLTRAADEAAAQADFATAVVERFRAIIRSLDERGIIDEYPGMTALEAAALTHRNLIANVEQSIDWVPVLHEGAEVFYCVLPLFHAFGFTIGFLAGLRMGATIAMFPKFDQAMILTSQKRLPCTFFLGVPPMYQRLLATAKQMGSDLSSIHFSLSGAMPLSHELADAWEEATGGLMIEGYGMTEASPIILGSPLASTRARGALGIAYPSTEVRIVDPEDPSRDVADGEVGELLARGPQVFPGYWNQPEETEACFVDGWLRTGDLVRLRDGFIYMADRRKEMINSSGFNVYPSQVEEAVRTMPGVRDVAIVGIPSSSSGEDVVAAIVLEAGASVTLADIREWAEKSIAHYALPRQLVVMSELPRSQLGKVMRKKVREQITGMTGGAIQAAKGAVEGARGAVEGARDAVGEAARGAARGATDALRRITSPEDRQQRGQQRD